MKTIIFIIGLFLLVGCEKTEIGTYHEYTYKGSGGHYKIEYSADGIIKSTVNDANGWSKHFNAADYFVPMVTVSDIFSEDPVNIKIFKDGKVISDITYN